MLRRYLALVLVSLASFGACLGVALWLTAEAPPTETAPVAAAPASQEVLARVAALEQRVAEDWQNGDDWKMLGRSYMALGRYLDAVGAWSQAARLLPRDPEVQAALQRLADIAAARGRHEDQVTR